MNTEAVEYIAAHRDELPTPIYIYSESALTEAVMDDFSLSETHFVDIDGRTGRCS